MGARYVGATAKAKMVLPTQEGEQRRDDGKTRRAQRPGRSLTLRDNKRTPGERGRRSMSRRKQH